MFSLTVVVTALLASFVSAQSFSGLPQCAVSYRVQPKFAQLSIPQSDEIEELY
jgi:hypothetical protein